MADKWLKHSQAWLIDIASMMNQIDQSSIPFYQPPNINMFLKTIREKQCHFIRFNDIFFRVYHFMGSTPKVSVDVASISGWDTSPGSERSHWWGFLRGRQDENLNHCQVSTSTIMTYHLKLIIWIIDVPHQDPNPKTIIKKHGNGADKRPCSGVKSTFQHKCSIFISWGFLNMFIISRCLQWAENHVEFTKHVHFWAFYFINRHFLMTILVFETLCDMNIDLFMDSQAQLSQILYLPCQLSQLLEHYRT